ncbi:MAG: ABC transporter permease, partial [Chitinophagales bacterium]
MKNIFTIFSKEIKDILRDKRTLTVMLLIPLVVYPAIFIGITKYMTAQNEKAVAETLRIGIISNGNQSDFETFVSTMPNTKISPVSDTTSAKEAILSDSIDVAYFFPEGFDSAVAKLQGTGFQYFYTSTNNEFEVAIIENINTVYKQALVKKKLAQIEVSETVLEPAKSISRNLASAREQLGSVIGGILPYFFIIFCMIGCMYPAIDLAAGEKER